MRRCVFSLLFLALFLPPRLAQAQGTVPTFQITAGPATYTVAGMAPAAATTTIPTLLVPVILTFESGKAGKPFVMDATADVPAILRSPVFSNFAFPTGGKTQYADALMRTTFAGPPGWHTLLGKPQVKAIRISVPAGYGYVMTSKATGRSVAVADMSFVQKEIFKQIPNQPGRLVIAVTHNVSYYPFGDATECCAWGTHGVNSATGNSFVLASYLHDAPSVVEDQDVQGLTQQLAQFFKDPLFDPLAHGRGVVVPGNSVPPWLRLAWQVAGDEGPCGGVRVATNLFLLEPTDTNPKNNFPASKAFIARSEDRAYHLQNVALLPWYTDPFEGWGGAWSFPDAQALTQHALPCPPRMNRDTPPMPAVSARPLPATPNGHKLIGYWTGYGPATSHIPLPEVSPQWDIIIVAFATVDPAAPEGTMQFHVPIGMEAAQFKADIANMKARGGKVMLALGGGGAHFALQDQRSVPNFVESVGRIVGDYGFDGVDIDFETPALSLDPGDRDFRHPTTPSTVNLIAALRQLHDRFGPGFMISLVPEGTQIPSGYPSYGGQFGSYLPIAWGLRDILTFMDTQHYNTPPLQGLDGEIYQPGTVDYHAAMTELVLRGFPTGGDHAHFYPPVPADKYAVGFLTSDTIPMVVSQAMEYLITGKAPPGAKYKLRNPKGYPNLIGAMFWNMNSDRYAGYNFSNLVGPQLHGYPAGH
ncbi:MAG TPA: glycosyl hydrolase family 18 protein [Rhizomicrobium sp.]|nr:glycosyl hydrolase family 18 protein [Rhizomicrobium sp.]